MIPLPGALRHPLDAIPLIPDRDEAREWAEQELSDPVYEAAEPTPLDRIARGIGDFIAQLLSPDLSGGWGPTIAIIATAVVVLAIIAAFLIWGVPRSARRAPAPTAMLFGEEEARSAADLRRAAAAHAKRGEWDAAVVLRFRALARWCQERGVLDTPPGATVHAFARAAGAVFPGFAGDLERAATDFDDVRYLRRPGTAAAYERVAALDDALASIRPAARDEVPA